MLLLLVLVKEIGYGTIKMTCNMSDHLTSNNLVNLHQSAYCKHHSTETALLLSYTYMITLLMP